MELPEKAQVQIRESETMAVYYADYTIDTPQKYQDSAADLKIIKATAKELSETRMSITRPLEESKKRIIALFKKPLDVLVKAESSVKTAMVTWQSEQERIRRVEEARLIEIQRKETEKLRIKAEREVARAESLKTDKAKAAALTKARELFSQAEEVTAIAPRVESSVQKVAGISTMAVWKFEIEDLDSLPREYMIPDEVYIGKIVKASKGKKAIPGVRIYSKNVISSR